MYAQVEGETQANKAKLLGHLSFLTFGGTHSTGVCLESPMCQARCEETTVRKTDRVFFPSGVLDLVAKTDNNRISIYYMLCKTP